MYTLTLHGRRSVKLQEWLSLKKVSAFFSSATAADVSPPQDGRKGKTFTVSYLVDSLGLTTKVAESIKRKVGFEEKGNPDSVLRLLRSYGFTDSQISRIITDYPRLLIADAEKSIGPKLQFLLSRGASISELTQIVSTVPKILGKDRSISRYYDFVRDIVEADKSSKSCDSWPEGLWTNKMRNVLVLRELGVPQKLLFPLFISEDGPVHGKERFEESLKKVIEMGFDPSTSKFVQALCVVYKISDKTTEEKVNNVYKRLGFDVDDVWEIFKKWPSFLTLSEKNIMNSIETFLGLGFTKDEFTMMIKCFPQCIGLSADLVKKKTGFVVKKMNWPLKAMTSFPQALGYSMEKRIVPRCNVIKALISKGYLGSELPPLASVLAIADQAFLDKYLMKHDDRELVAELMAIFTGGRVS